MSGNSLKRTISPQRDFERHTKQKTTNNCSDEREEEKMSALTMVQNNCIMPGTKLPDLTAPALIDKNIGSVKLSTYKGNWLCILFYQYDFEKTSSTFLIKDCSKKISDFMGLQCVVLSCSTDSCYAHLAWVGTGDIGKVRFPMLSDTSHELSNKLGLLDKSKGTARNAVVIVNPDQIVQQVLLTNDGCGQSADTILAIVQEFKIRGFNMFDNDN